VGSKTRKPGSTGSGIRTIYPDNTMIYHGGIRTKKEGGVSPL